MQKPLQQVWGCSHAGTWVTPMRSHPEGESFPQGELPCVGVWSGRSELWPLGWGWEVGRVKERG